MESRLPTYRTFQLTSVYLPAVHLTALTNLYFTGFIRLSLWLLAGIKMEESRMVEEVIGFSRSRLRTNL